MKAKGFTLLEVMIALAIFAVCAVTFTKQLSRSSNLRYSLIEKEQALWLAKNELASLAIKGEKISEQLGQKTIEYASRSWLLKTASIDSVEGLSGVEVLVANEQLPDAVIVRLKRHYRERN